MFRNRLHFVPGALHIHTTCSDGGGTVPEVVEAACAAGLTWIIITDHETLAGQVFEGWHQDLFVTFGHEITPEQNHFLAFDVSYVVSRDQPVQAFLDEVYAQGGFGIIAHPDDELHRWEDWTIDGPRDRDNHVFGLELWNFMGDWRKSRKTNNRALMHMFPQLGLRGPTPALLDWWDRLNQSGKRTFGVGGLDAHAHRRRMPWGLSMQVFSYRWMFKTIINYLVLDKPLSVDVPTARAQIFGALKGGRSYFLNRFYGDAPQVRFVAYRGDREWLMGDTPSLAGGSLTIEADIGSEAPISLLCNGRVVSRASGRLQYVVNQPGVYRLEGYRRQRPWLFTNPIYIV